jgi:hypothetical protein
MKSICIAKGITINYIFTIPLIQLHLHRMLLFEMDEYESSRNNFELAMKLCASKGKDISHYQRWIRKCDAELQGAMLLVK